MTVQELIMLLEDCDPEAEVRLAHQAHYPLAFHAQGIAVPVEDGEAGLDDYDDDNAEEDAQPENVVWILEGSHPDQPYAPSYLWDIARVA